MFMIFWKKSGSFSTGKMMTEYDHRFRFVTTYSASWTAFEDYPEWSTSWTLSFFSSGGFSRGNSATR